MLATKCEGPDGSNESNLQIHKPNIDRVSKITIQLAAFTFMELDLFHNSQTNESRFKQTQRESQTNETRFTNVICDSQTNETRFTNVFCDSQINYPMTFVCNLTNTSYKSLHSSVWIFGTFLTHLDSQMHFF